MIDASITNAIDDMNQRSRDALGYSTPGAQPKFHEALSSKVQSVGIDDPLSVAAPALSFFVVQNTDGTRGYVRAGNFQVRDSKLMTQDGRQVLGYPMGRTQGGLEPMGVPAGTPDGWVNIAADGTISVGDPKKRNAADLGNAYLAQTLDGVGAPTAAAPDVQGASQHHKAIGRARDLGLSDGAAAAADTAPADGASGTVTPKSNTTPFNPTPMSNSGMSTLGASGSAATTDGSTSPLSVAANSSAALSSPDNDLGGKPAADGITAPNKAGMPKNFKAEDEEDALDRAADIKANKTAQSKTPDPRSLAGAFRGPDAPAFGQPIGRIALARFGFGTTVDTAGSPTSRVPVELGVPKSGKIGGLRSNSRDLGNVDLISASTAIMNASQVLTAVMTEFQSEQSRQKTAMGLIK